MTRQDGKSAILRLVDDFDKNERQYMSKDFQETENRDRFIDPFFTALGWDFYQTGTAKRFWDVHREFSNIDSGRIASTPWVLHGSDDLDFVDKLGVHPKLGAFCDNIFVGVQTSADKVFILEYEGEDDVYYTAKSKALDKTLRLEQIVELKNRKEEKSLNLENKPCRPKPCESATAPPNFSSSPNRPGRTE